MDPIKLGDTGAAVEDVQQRLVAADFLDASAVDGVFGEQTVAAVCSFCQRVGLPATGEVDEKTWSHLVDASYSMGDRTLYLRMPYFHGADVRQLQHALGALGFPVIADGIFGVYTEDALRKFQLNMALYSDGIAGAQTFRALRNLRHSWEGKPMTPPSQAHMSFARAADVLEQRALCVYGTKELSRNVASRLSNLSLATNPNSRIVSADSLLVRPDEAMAMIHIVLPDEEGMQGAPVVLMDNEDALAVRLSGGLAAAMKAKNPRLTVKLPAASWEGAGDARTAQHYAVALLDALCVALSKM